MCTTHPRTARMIEKNRANNDRINATWAAIEGRRAQAAYAERVARVEAADPATLGADDRLFITGHRARMAAVEMGRRLSATLGTQ